MLFEENQNYNITDFLSFLCLRGHVSARLQLFFVLNGRLEETVTVYPADVVLFEGILMFYSQDIRDLFQMKLFVDTDADTRLSRRGEARMTQQTHEVMRLINESSLSRWELNVTIDTININNIT